VVYLGDALYEGGIRGFVHRFAQVLPAALLRLAPVPDPTHYGVALVEDGVVKELEEKPARPKSDLAITGLYAFPPDFFEALRRIPPSARGELELTDAMADFLEHSRCVEPEIWDGEWVDAGQPQSFLEANRLMLGRCSDMTNTAAIDDSTINGNVGAGEGTEITRSRIRGPVLLGRSCRIADSDVGPNVCIGDRAVVENSLVRDTVIDLDTVVSGVRCGLQTSIVGRDSKVIGTGRTSQPVSKLVGDNAEERIQ
jgi:glucose-1-phosphate thymidylyltransferase